MTPAASPWRELIQIFARNPWETVTQMADYRKLCEQYVMNTGFQTGRSRVENAAVRIQTRMRKAAGSAAEVAAGLELLRRTRAKAKDQDLYYAFLSVGYKAGWAPAQQQYFEEAYEKLRLPYDFFFSFTTRYEHIAGENPVNNSYKHFILKVLTPEEWAGADRRQENLLAKAVFTLLAEVQGHKGFFFPDSQYDNSYTEEKLERMLRDSHVFLQLIQNVMFRPPNEGENYCYFEFVRARRQLDESQARYRMLFVVAERARTTFIPANRVHPDYEDWHTEVATRDGPYIPEVAAPLDADGRFQEIKTLIEEKLAAQVEAAWDRLIAGVPT